MGPAAMTQRRGSAYQRSHRIEQNLAPLHDRRAFVGQPGPAALTLEQLQSERALQRPDPGARRRLADVVEKRGLSDRTEVRDAPQEIERCNIRQRLRKWHRPTLYGDVKNRRSPRLKTAACLLL